MAAGAKGGGANPTKFYKKGEDVLIDCLCLSRRAIPAPSGLASHPRLSRDRAAKWAGATTS